MFTRTWWIWIAFLIAIKLLASRELLVDSIKYGTDVPAQIAAAKTATAIAGPALTPARVSPFDRPTPVPPWDRPTPTAP